MESVESYLFLVIGIILLDLFTKKLQKNLRKIIISYKNNRRKYYHSCLTIRYGTLF